MFALHTEFIYNHSAPVPECAEYPQAAGRISKFTASPRSQVPAHGDNTGRVHS